MKREMLAVVLTFILAVSLTAIAASKAPQGKITIKLTGKKDATFDHTTHEGRVENCQACHHKDAAGAEQKCTGCHTAVGKEGAVEGKKAFHKMCLDCHKKEGKGPKACKGCHLGNQG